MLRASYVGVFLLVAMMMASAPTPALAEFNIIRNPGFEDGTLAYWRYQGNWEISSPGASGSTYYASAIVEDGGASLTWYSLPQCARSLDFYYRGGYTGDGDRIEVWIYYADGMEAESLEEQSSWTQVSINLDTAKTVREVYIFIGTTGSGYLDVDGFDLEACTVAVSVDIKPGSYPNSINLQNKGVVPVAVLSTSSFNASIVDPSTVEFAGASPVKWTLKDVNGDGAADLVLHFNTKDLTDLTGSSTQATLTGTTYGGTLITGTDTVKIVKE
jgi:hypothetical protein